MRHPMEKKYADGNLFKASGTVFESIDVKVNVSTFSSNKNPVKDMHNRRSQKESEPTNKEMEI